MKIIFSRKGFDKKNGGAASPIFPDRGLRSLPIPAPWLQKRPPAPRYCVRFKDLTYDSESLGSVVEDLSLMPRKGKSRIKGSDLCHLDPDLIRGDLDRRPGWLPVFGQGNAACAHLFNHGVQEGDLFLFFGWFHRVRKQKSADRFEFDPNGQDAHVIFGWLQVGEIWCEFNAESVLPKWARYHPHVCGQTDNRYNLRKPVDVLFIAKRRLELPAPGMRLRLPGGGVFKKYDKRLKLTETGNGRRIWRVPAWMYPFPDRPPLTYHSDKKRWKKVGRRSLLRTVDRGQEFVLNADYYPKAYEWLANLFKVAD